MTRKEPVTFTHAEAQHEKRCPGYFVGGSGARILDHGRLHGVCRLDECGSERVAGESMRKRPRAGA